MCEWFEILHKKNSQETELDYLKRLYIIFKNTIIENKLYFSKSEIKIRSYPKIDGFEQAFYHVVTIDEKFYIPKKEK